MEEASVVEEFVVSLGFNFVHPFVLFCECQKRLYSRPNCHFCLRAIRSSTAVAGPFGRTGNHPWTYRLHRPGIPFECSLGQIAFLSFIMKSPHKFTYSGLKPYSLSRQRLSVVRGGTCPLACLNGSVKIVCSFCRFYHKL